MHFVFLSCSLFVTDTASKVKMELFSLYSFALERGRCLSICLSAIISWPSAADRRKAAAPLIIPQYENYMQRVI